MPVTINGDGSITGLAVGGLPDGSVDADTLASNAVTSAKLASGAITRSALPAGSVLQTVQVTTTTQTENAFSSAQTFLTASITPTDSNNKILVNVNCCGCGSRNTSTFWRMRIKRDGSLLRGVASYIGGYGDDSGNEDYPSCSFLDSPGTTNAITYTLQGNRVSGSANCYFNHHDGSGTNSQGQSSMTLMEIAV
jgi:hypothetical protein